MTGRVGRVRNLRFIMITGNRDGLCGYSVTRAQFGTGSAGFRRAVNKAGYRVCYFDRYENRTVYHDFFTQYGSTRYVNQCCQLWNE